MKVSLTPEMERLVTQKVESGRYRDAGEVVSAALGLLQGEEEAESRLEGLLEEAELSGESIELTAEARREIEEEALGRLHARKSA